MSIRMSRRSILLGGALTLALPAVLRAQPLHDYDAVIVGAGAAGLAAAKTLKNAGRSFIVLEARNRRGGRAYTEATSLGVPFDQGAHWLHNAHLNPFMAIAKRLGRELRASSVSDIRFFEDGTKIAAGYTDFEKGATKVERRLGLRSLWRGDFAATDLDLSDPWQRAAADVAAFSMAVDLDEMSVDDFASLEAGDDYVVSGGFGRLVVDNSRDIDVRYDHVVKRISWGAHGRVEVAGDFGGLSAGACIITVPSPVLAATGIAFDPILPDHKINAFRDLSGGHFMKVGMRLTRPLEGLPEYTFDIAKARRGQAVAFHFDQKMPIATMIVSGRHAADLAGLAKRDLFDLAQSELSRVAGRQVAQGVSAATSHDWSADPFARGAYSVRRIGADTARRDYAETIADKLYFAGEAAGRGLTVTVAGAHVSGIEAARQVIESGPG